MIRFIDLGKQIAVDENDPEYPREFAFFNTVSDLFLTFGGSQMWGSWKEFEEDFDQDGELFKRIKSLCPSWVLDQKNSEQNFSAPGQ